MGYDSQVIQAGRTVNDFMPGYVAELTARALKETGKPVQGAKVLVLGLTYKENVAETREAPVWQVIEELRERGVDVFAFDPLLKAEDIEAEFSGYGVTALSGLKSARGMDCVVLAVAHDAFKNVTLDELKGFTKGKPVLIDIRGFYSRQEAEEKGFFYKSL